MKATTTPSSPHDTASFPSPDDPETASSGAPRGRPSVYAPRIIDMVCGEIREHGLSDSAAAESVGMSSSTISRWKQQFPEIVPQLQQARQECRKRHLRNIEKHADSDSAATSLRASMWILERVFPEDYARRASERMEHRDAAEWRRHREADALYLEQCAEELKADLARERAQNEARQKAAAATACDSAAATTADAENRASAFEGDSHNSRNAEGE